MDIETLKEHYAKSGFVFFGFTAEGKLIFARKCVSGIQYVKVKQNGIQDTGIPAIISTEDAEIMYLTYQEFYGGD